MGAPQLKNKISSVVRNNESFTEVEVVYVVVECWKYCERINSKQYFPFLRFIRNWCVHTKIDSPGETFSKILKSKESDGYVKYEIIMEGLKEEILRLFETFGTELFIDYNSFLLALCEVLGEQPVKFDGEKFCLELDYDAGKARIVTIE